MVKDKKIWFKGINRRLWVPVSIEGFAVTALFFGGIILIHKINNFSNDASLTMSQFLLILVEFGTLLGFLYFVTNGHVDKKYLEHQ